MSFKKNILKIYSEYKNNGIKSVLKQFVNSMMLIPLFIMLPIGLIGKIINATNLYDALFVSVMGGAIYFIYIMMVNIDVKSFKEDKRVSIEEIKKYLREIENKEEKRLFARRIASEMMIDKFYGIKETRFRDALKNKHIEVENINMSDKKIRIYECIVKSLLDEKVINTKQKEKVIL